MLTLDQVRSLEDRVGRAVSTIDRLAAENAALRGELERSRERERELERTVEEFRRDQERIEEGIVSALRKLDALEDAAIRERSERPAGLVNAGAAAPVASSPVAEPEPELEAAPASDARGVAIESPPASPDPEPSELEIF